MKTWSIIISIFLFFSCDTAENLEPVQADVFFKYFGGKFSDLGVDLQQTSDDGFILIGSSSSFSEGQDFDLYVVKTDRYGNAVWELNLGGEGDDYGKSVIQTADGYYLLGNDGTKNGHFFLLVKLDLNGNVVWEKSYSSLQTNINSFDARQLFLISDQMVMVGSAQTANKMAEIVLLRADLGGNVTNPTEVDFTFGFTGNDFGISVVADASGNGFFLAQTDLGPGDGLRPYISLINGQNKGPLNFEVENTAKIILTSDGRLVVLGTLIQDGIRKVFISKIRPNLDQEDDWPKVFDIENVKAESIIETEDGGFLISGIRDISPVNSDMILFKVDVNGNLINDVTWPKTFGNEFADNISSVIQTQDGGYAFTGSISTNALGNHKMCLIKINQQGELKILR